MFISEMEMTKKLAKHTAYQFTSFQTFETMPLLKKDRISHKPIKNMVVTRKVTYKNAGIGYVYGKSVNNKRRAENNDHHFIPLALPWGQYVTDSKTVIENRGKYFLRVALWNNTTADSEYYLNGKRVTKTSVLPILKAIPKKVTGSKRQDLQVVNERKVIALGISKITSINLSGKHYVIDDVNAIADKVDKLAKDNARMKAMYLDKTTSKENA